MREKEEMKGGRNDERMKG